MASCNRTTREFALSDMKQISIQSLSQAASDFLDVTDDVALRKALHIDEERIGVLRDSTQIW